MVRGFWSGGVNVKAKYDLQTGKNQKREAANENASLFYRRVVVVGLFILRCGTGYAGAAWVLRYAS